MNSRFLGGTGIVIPNDKEWSPDPLCVSLGQGDAEGTWDALNRVLLCTLHCKGERFAYCTIFAESPILRFLALH